MTTLVLIDGLTEAQAIAVARVISRDCQQEVQPKQIPQDMLRTTVLEGPYGIGGWRKGLAWAESEGPRPQPRLARRHRASV